MSRETTDEAATASGKKRATLTAWAVLYLKGVAMGAADTVPGVSGGTIAFITGIYERLIRALTELDPRILSHLSRVHRPEARTELLGRLREMDVGFLIVLGLGVVTSVVGISRFVHTALSVARPQTFAFFFGLIAASAIVLFEHLSVATAGRAAAAVIGFVLAFFLAGASSMGLFGHALPVIFASGAVAITAMILPGVSGAFILLLLGQYEHLTGVLERFVDGLIAAASGAGSLQGLTAGLTVVVVFGVGAVVGLLTVAHIVRRALDRYRAATLAFLVSLMIGSLRLPIVEVADGVNAWTPVSAATVVGAAAIGGGAVLALDFYTDDLEYA